MFNFYRKPTHIEAPPFTPANHCPWCSCQSFSKTKGCPDCSVFLPSPFSERNITARDRRKYREPNSLQDHDQDNDFIDDNPDDDLTDDSLPPTTDEIEALNYDNIDQYIPSTTQEIY